MGDQHNGDKTRSYWLGLNEFADLTWDEFAATHLGYKEGPRFGDLPKVPFPNITDVADSIDWVAKGAVTPVKNQKHCGSCWAISATGALEGAYFVASGKLVSLSEEDLVQCDHGGDHGCQGGLMDNAFRFVEKNGISSEADYPYTSGGGVTGSCNGGLEHRPAVTIKSYTDVPRGDENALKAAVSKQPVSVAIEADQYVFQHYGGGILDNPGCGRHLDHGVLVVGYGTDNGKEYWKVKNSWGASWGEQGYIRMVRNKDQCGIASEPSYPTGAEAAHPPVPPTPAPPMPEGCKIEGPSRTHNFSYPTSATIDYSSCKAGAGMHNGVKDAAMCASLCKANSNCTAFHYYGIGDIAYGDCYLHRAGIVGRGPLHDGRDRYAGTCGTSKPCPHPPMPAGCSVAGPSYKIDVWSVAPTCPGDCGVWGAFPLKGVKDVTACASQCKAHSSCAAFHYYGADDRAYGDCYLYRAGKTAGPLHDGRDRYAGTCDSSA